MKAVRGSFRSRLRRLCAAGVLIALGAALSGCIGTPASTSAGYCDQHPFDNRC